MLDVAGRGDQPAAVFVGRRAARRSTRRSRSGASTASRSSPSRRHERGGLACRRSGRSPRSSRHRALRIRPHPRDRIGPPPCLCHRDRRGSPESVTQTTGTGAGRLDVDDGVAGDHRDRAASSYAAGGRGRGRIDRGVRRHADVRVHRREAAISRSTARALPTTGGRAFGGRLAAMVELGRTSGCWRGLGWGDASDGGRRRLSGRCSPGRSVCPGRAEGSHPRRPVRSSTG